jgi:hypothetical protein
MDEEQRFAFDTFGFLTVEDAIAPEQVAELKATVDGKGPDLHSQHADRGGFWSQDFFDLLDVPALADILDEIYGGVRAGGLPPFRVDHINVHTHGTFNKDFAGGTIHGGNGRLLNPQRAHELATHYFTRDAVRGTFANGLVTVAFELEDTVCNGGGFGCLAGSHKGSYRVPDAWVDLSKGVHPMVTRVPARAGTAIVFTEALCHVTLPWTVPSTRTTLFYKYTDREETYSGTENFFSPADADPWQGGDERKRAILAPPPQTFVERKLALAQREAEAAKQI